MLEDQRNTELNIEYNNKFKRIYQIYHYYIKFFSLQNKFAS